MTEAEIELWLAVARSVQPREGAQLPVTLLPARPQARPDPPKPTPAPHVKGAGRVPFLPPYRPPVQAPAPAPMQPPLAPFDKRYRQKVVRGRVEIDGAIDLHGMTQPEAHAALNGFLRASSSGGARLVLVVTGKGRSRIATANEPGVLRRAVPLWLKSDVLRPIVMGFEEAGPTHGGLGALYVRLRRRDS